MATNPQTSAHIGKARLHGMYRLRPPLPKAWSGASATLSRRVVDHIFSALTTLRHVVKIINRLPLHLHRLPASFRTGHRTSWRDLESPAAPLLHHPMNCCGSGRAFATRTGVFRPRAERSRSPCSRPFRRQQAPLDAQFSMVPEAKPSIRARQMLPTMPGLSTKMPPAAADVVRRRRGGFRPPSAHRSCRTGAQAHGHQADDATTTSRQVS